jgi:hypothetical protein
VSPRILIGALLVTFAVIGADRACAEKAAEEPPSVTPYRPSVSTPATLSAPGWLEFEAGGLSVRADGAVRRDSLPYTVKLAFDPDWGVRVSGEAWVSRTDASDQRSSGLGDSSLVVKRRFAVDEAQAFGLELGVSLPTGAAAVGDATAAWSVNGIYSADLGVLHTDLNLAATRIGAPDAGVSRLQKLWAASLSGPLGPRWGLLGELSGTGQHGASATSQLLVAATYNASRRLVLDGGFARSLRSDNAQTSIFIGLTALGPRLF